MKSVIQPSTGTSSASPEPLLRSSAVARMAQMPVATLRIWEQRYQAVQPASAPSGHRRYSVADVQRVVLLRQLAEHGHAIGTLAGLSTAQLQGLAAQLGLGGALPVAGRSAPAAALRLLVVGHALAARLQRPAVLRVLQEGWRQAVDGPIQPIQRIAPPIRLLAVFESLDEAVAAVGLAAAPRAACDLLICQLPGLAVEALPELLALQAAWPGASLAVAYRFAGASAKAEFAAHGVVLLREPPDDEDLGRWLLGQRASGLTANGDADAADAANGANALEPVAGPAGFEPLMPGAVPPRRFDDAALTAIAGLPPTLACECPRHMAELLMQLASFEAYSAACVSRNPAEAKMHAELQQVAGSSRALFESALEHLARHEGLKLD